MYAAYILSGGVVGVNEKIKKKINKTTLVVRLEDTTKLLKLKAKMK